MLNTTTRPPREQTPAPAPVYWTDSEPARLERDQTEIGAFAPLLKYVAPDNAEFPHGGWHGALPMWPFDRPQPDGIEVLLDGQGLTIQVHYSAAHPMVPPAIYPLEPVPTREEESQTVWHVAPGGSICVLQSVGGWQPEASVTELLAKAAGWRVEYALMKAGLITEMSLHGIVSDASYDHLIAQAASRLSASELAPAGGDSDA